MFRKTKINQKYLSLRYVSNRGGQSCVCVCVWGGLVGVGGGIVSEESTWDFLSRIYK